MPPRTYRRPAAIFRIGAVTAAALATMLPARVVRAQAAPQATAGSGGRPPAVARYVAVEDSVVALTQVRLVDGTGRPARDDQTIVVANGRVRAVGPSADVPVPAGARVLALAGHTVIPGLVGMHDHLYYSSGFGGSMKLMRYSYPKLFLAAGVTTIRTTGSVDSYQELLLRREIEAGEEAGPEVVVTGPYIQGVGPSPKPMFQLSGPDDARRMVRYWASEGVTWFKAYTHITRAELAAAIDEAHKRGVRVTAHLCSVGFREAVALGIDNLEHGLLTNTEFIPGKRPDVCPPESSTPPYETLDVQSADVQRTITEMVRRRVPLTSTLAVFEVGIPSRIPRDARVLAALHPEVAARAEANWWTVRDSAADAAGTANLKSAMAFERAFVAAGGLLAAGSDPCCQNAVAGYADQRNYELLVEAGFTPEAAVRIMTLNGATVLGAADRIGSVEAGKQADLVVLRGDPTRTPASIREVTLVFRRGVGYDPEKLTADVKGLIGVR